MLSVWSVSATLDRRAIPAYPRGMSGAPDTHQLARQIAVPEERMNTHQADYRVALERMERKMAGLNVEAVRRDKANIQWVAGPGIAVITSIIGGFVILGLMTT